MDEDVSTVPGELCRINSNLAANIHKLYNEYKFFTKYSVLRHSFKAFPLSFTDFYIKKQTLGLLVLRELY